MSEYHKNYDLELSKFRNRKCEICGKLLHYQTKGNFCRECMYSNKEYFKKEIESKKEVKK